MKLHWQLVYFPITDDINTKVFGTVEDLRSNIDLTEFPVIVKLAAGAMGKGNTIVTERADSKRKITRKVKNENLDNLSILFGSKINKNKCSKSMSKTKYFELDHLNQLINNLFLQLSIKGVFCVLQFPVTTIQRTP